MAIILAAVFFSAGVVGLVYGADSLTGVCPAGGALLHSLRCSLKASLTAPDLLKV
jgi:hypothetical protein